LGREKSNVCRRAGQYVLDQQQLGGGWSIYPGGPVDLSASVKAYFALKLVGFEVDHPAMKLALASVLEAGGAQNVNSFTRFYLALLGQMDYDATPCVPPELVLLPRSLPFSLSAMSAWTRTIVVPLSVISATKPVRTLAPERGIAELFRDDLPRRVSRWTRPRWSWANFFLVVDKVLKFYDRFAPAVIRRPGLKAVHRWMLEHFENSDGLGAIFPPMVFTVIALRCLGHEEGSPELEWAERQLDDLLLPEGDALKLQPCVSPVWDTAIAMIALADSGIGADDPALERGVRWLLDKEVRTLGDWARRRRGLEPTGWHFQYQNSHYPDIDDTAMVLLALDRSQRRFDPDVTAARKRAVAWLLAMQNKDGGWAAFDADIDNQVLTKVPFADHNAMLDPSCADITARVLEFLGILGHGPEYPAVARGLQYLWDTQEPAGCWYGRWGVNYIYGTWQVLLGLRAIGFSMDEPRVRRAVDWLESTQQPSGGWGESCASYDDPSAMGIGEPTASQTAWAVLGLLAAGRVQSEAVLRGISYLLESRLDEGTWRDDQFTGTGFPSVFYLRYHLYPATFPLMAIGRYRSELRRAAKMPTEVPIAAAVPLTALRLSSDGPPHRT
jgi:squalene-hopene/tetraprenyl-beta-curcumene cyclase